ACRSCQRHVEVDAVDHDRNDRDFRVGIGPGGPELVVAWRDVANREGAVARDVRGAGGAEKPAVLRSDLQGEYGHLERPALRIDGRTGYGGRPAGNQGDVGSAGFLANANDNSSRVGEIRRAGKVRRRVSHRLFTRPDV